MFPLAAFSAAACLIMTGTVAGLFFAYSVSVMPALDAVGSGPAVVAMQSVNQKIQNGVFLSAFMLAPVAAVAAGVPLWLLGRRAAAVLFLAAAAVYVLGALLPTIAVNVPMNDALDAARIPADPDAAARLWSDYSSRWTRWNHVRTVFGSLSLLLAGGALYAWGKQS